MVALCTVCRSINGHSLNIRFLRGRSMNSLHGRSPSMSGRSMRGHSMKDRWFLYFCSLPPGVTICVAV